tara:strand:+ start:15467 stop:16636 length:1170 start_codon:yes stop_codon:yes gene_type:complete
VIGIKKFFRKYRQHLPLFVQRKYFKCVTLKPNGVPKGRVLVSYAVTSAGLSDNNKLFNYHTGPWESNKITSIFLELGYVVDVIHYNNKKFTPTEKYDVIFGVTGNLLRLVEETPGNPVVLFHPRTSSIKYNNKGEVNRIENLKKRRGVSYKPKRQEPYEDREEEILKVSDGVILIGNERTLSTYTKEFQSKIIRIPVSTSPLKYVKNKFVPKEREFMWHFGRGAVHKGLDLVLEVFAKHPEWKLNITGFIDREPDFMAIYKDELALPNIHFHGHLDPSSDCFIDIAKRSVAFIAPSVSESISVACANMMKLGLFPIVSRDTGIDLPHGAGIYLEDCSIYEIEEAVASVFVMDKSELEDQIRRTQKVATNSYTRELFEEVMKDFIVKHLK